MPQTTIFHVDVNSAFLSWKAVYQIKEQGSLVDLREIPSAVGGDEDSRHGVVLAKSIPAKKFGVRTGGASGPSPAQMPPTGGCPAGFPPVRPLFPKLSADSPAICPGGGACIH